MKAYFCQCREAVLVLTCRCVGCEGSVSTSSTGRLRQTCPGFRCLRPRLINRFLYSSMLMQAT